MNSLFHQSPLVFPSFHSIQPYLLITQPSPRNLLKPVKRCQQRHLLQDAVLDLHILQYHLEALATHPACKQFDGVDVPLGHPA